MPSVGFTRTDIWVGLPYRVGEGPHGNPVIAHQAFSEAAKAYLVEHVLANIEFRNEVEAFRREWTTSFEVEAGPRTGWDAE